jgi:hypothetical protein
VKRTLAGERTMEKFEKMAAQGAMATAGGILALYFLLLFLWRPTATSGAPDATGGFTPLLWGLLAVAMLVPIGILVGVHIAFGRDLKSGAKPMH